MQRRTIKTRDRKWAQNIAKFISKLNISPDAISILSVFFALCSGIMFCFIGQKILPEKLYFLIPLSAIILMQLRLLCNLLDGMVAVECNKHSVLGDIYNEFPDRLSDSFIFVGVGVGGQTVLSLVLGLLLALFAMFTAYTRVLGGAIGTKQYFLGPMAKQHRMAFLTVTMLACLFSSTINIKLIPIVLTIMILGCSITVSRRIVAIAKELKANKTQD